MMIMKYDNEHIYTTIFGYACVSYENALGVPMYRIDDIFDQYNKNNKYTKDSGFYYTMERWLSRVNSNKPLQFEYRFDRPGFQGWYCNKAVLNAIVNSLDKYRKF